MRKFIALTFVLFSIVSAAQTNYYVDGTNGNNANNGLTLSTAWKTIQKACNSAVANSIVHIKGGVYHENVVVHSSGTAGNPIVYTNYNNDVVILDGAGTSGTVMLSITDKSFLTFENILIQNLTSIYAKGISLNTAGNSCNGITFRNITVRNIGWTANAAELPEESDNSWAMYIRGQSGGITNLTIEGCSVHDNVLGYSEAVTIGGNVDGFIIENSLVYDNTNIGIHVSGNDLNGVGPRNGIIRGNTCYGNMSPIALSAGIYLDGSHDITVEKNSCYQNPIGIEVGCEKNGESQYVNIKNNIIYNNQYTGLAVGGYTTDTTGQVLDSTFRNNTFFQNNSNNNGIAEITISKASNCVFEDNIIYSNAQNILMTMLDIQPQENNTINYNCWYTPSGNVNNLIYYWGQATYHSFNAYKNGTGQDSNSIYTNPVFGSALLPQPELLLLGSSLCINTGNPVLAVTVGETDFDGNPRVVSSVIDIGAREFNPGLGLGFPQTPSEKVIIAPNPFAVQTRISTSTELSDATFLLYDFSGRKVREMSGLNGSEIALERQNLNSGLYLYKIVQDGKAIATGKLVVE
jgi:hypothetical protein